MNASENMKKKVDEIEKGFLTEGGGGIMLAGLAILDHTKGDDWEAENQKRRDLVKTVIAVGVIATAVKDAFTGKKD